MSDLPFFYPDGKTKFDSEEAFIDFYEQVYWYENGDVLLEEKMNEILASQDMLPSYFAQVLKWKTGGDYDDALDVVTYQYGNIATDQFQQFAGKKEGILGDPGRLFHALCQCERIGFVYGITLMYFISGGRYPIYDRFAHFALIAVQEELRPGEIIKDNRLMNPQIGDLESARSAFANYEAEFARLLVGSDSERLFHCEYSRKLDRALWAYGHLFNGNKRNSLRAKALLV